MHASPVVALFDQVGFSEGFENAIPQLSAIETLGRISPDGQVHLAREIRKIGNRVPSSEKLITVR